MKYWDASGIVPLLVRQARTRDMDRLLTRDPSVVTVSKSAPPARSLPAMDDGEKPYN